MDDGWKYGDASEPIGKRSCDADVDDGDDDGGIAGVCGADGNCCGVRFKLILIIDGPDGTIDAAAAAIEIAIALDV